MVTVTTCLAYLFLGLMLGSIIMFSILLVEDNLHNDEDTNHLMQYSIFMEGFYLLFNSINPLTLVTSTLLEIISITVGFMINYFYFKLIGKHQMKHRLRLMMYIVGAVGIVLLSLTIETVIG